MRIRAAGLVGLVLAAGSCATPTTESSPAGEPESAAPDRPLARAALLHRNGESRLQQITSDTVGIRTQFGDLTFRAGDVARIWASKRGIGEDVIVTTEGDRVVGALDWEHLWFSDGLSVLAQLSAAGPPERWLSTLPAFDPGPVHVIVFPNQDLVVFGAASGLIDMERLTRDAFISKVWFKVEPSCEATDVRRMRLGASREIGYHSDGLRITSLVPGSPAERAGWKPGDVITSLEGKPVRSNSEIVARRDAILSGAGVYMLVELTRDGRPVWFLIER